MDFPPDCLGTTEGRIHPAPVMPSLSVSDGKLTAGCKVIRGRKEFYKRTLVGRNNKPYRDFARYGLFPISHKSVNIVTYHVFIIDKQIVVSVAAIPELLAESSRHIAVFAWFAP